MHWTNMVAERRLNFISSDIIYCININSVLFPKKHIFVDSPHVQSTMQQVQKPMPRLTIRSVPPVKIQHQGHVGRFIGQTLTTEAAILPATRPQKTIWLDGFLRDHLMLDILRLSNPWFKGVIGFNCPLGSRNLKHLKLGHHTHTFIWFFAECGRNWSGKKQFQGFSAWSTTPSSCRPILSCP